MQKGLFLFLALLVFGLIVTIFLISYIIYLRMPAPKGCDKYKAQNRNCDACVTRGCERFIESYRKKAMKREKEAQEVKNS